MTTGVASKVVLFGAIQRETVVAVRLRLMRMGKKKQPTYRVVAADRRSPRDGRFIEIVGTYNPRQEPSEIKIDNAKAVGWLREGAQPSERVRKLLEISGAWEAYTSGRTRDELEAEAAAAAAAEAPEVDETAAPATAASSPEPESASAETADEPAEAADEPAGVEA